MTVTMRRRVDSYEGSARLAIYTETQSIVFMAPFAPVSVDYGGIEQQYDEQTRPDRKPLLEQSGGTLRTMSFELTLVSRGLVGPGGLKQLRSQQSRLDKLEKLALTNVPLIVEYEPSTKGKWRMSLSYTSVQRDPDTDEIIEATASLSFREIADVTSQTLNVTSRPRKITVKDGMTLPKIAEMYYGTTSSYIVNAIAKANKIKNARHLPKAITLP